MIEKAAELLEYCPETGALRWKLDRGRGGGAKKGEVAGCKLKQGKMTLIRINVCGKKLLAHIVAWFIYFGENPKGIIKHIDGNGMNNRIENLKLVKRKSRKVKKKRARGKKAGEGPGIHWNTITHQWEDSIGANFIGRFDKLEDGVDARKKAGQGLWFGEVVK